MWHLGPGAMTTLAYAVIDPAGETIELVNAGHPPPLLVDGAGGAEYLPSTGGIALGATVTAVYESQTSALPTGTVVFMYTDGLIETRGESIDVGLERLRTVAAKFSGVETLCAAVAAELVPDAPPDDVAFIAARVPPLSDHMTTHWPATPDVLAGIRLLLRRWLSQRGADDAVIFDITVACQEACANAIEHAYAPGPAAFELLLRHTDGTVELTIRDRGRWRPPRGENRGRGLPMMRALMDDVAVQDAADGTEVTLVKALGGAR
jgi:anti-sigma regulatory factor (Ser/Thr protein kinase)